MFLASSVSADLGLMDALVIALLGYAVVFFGLILLMIVVIVMGKLFAAQGKKTAEPKAEPAPVQASVPETVSTAVAAADHAAPGSAGQLKLHDVPPKTAAMLMAIVADKMGKPLNELRFISIKEVK